MVVLLVYNSITIIYIIYLSLILINSHPHYIIINHYDVSRPFPFLWALKNNRGDSHLAVIRLHVLCFRLALVLAATPRPPAPGTGRRKLKVGVGLDDVDQSVILLMAEIRLTS